MECFKILIKSATKNKNAVYVKIMKGINGNCSYSYYNGNSIDLPSKSTFNKYSFIEYLKGCNIPKKYIKEIENI